MYYSISKHFIFHFRLPVCVSSISANFFIFSNIVLGGCFVEGEWLRNAFRWKESIGPWEERPGHFGDVWMYWTDDGLGYFEFLQVGLFEIRYSEYMN